MVECPESEKGGEPLFYILFTDLGEKFYTYKFENLGFKFCALLFFNV